MNESLKEVLRDLEAKRAYVGERMKSERLPNRNQAADAVREEIAALGLERHVVALETNGYTVLTPEEVGCGDLVQRVNEAIDRVATRRSPQDADLAGAYGGFLFHLVPEDPVFEEVLLQRKPLALLTYLLGHHLKLNQSTALLKPKEVRSPPIHADAQGKFPLPWPETAQVANVNWLLSDYTREGGCLCVVPRSHRMGNPRSTPHSSTTTRRSCRSRRRPDRSSCGTAASGTVPCPARSTACVARSSSTTVARTSRRRSPTSSRPRWRCSSAIRCDLLR